MGLFGKSNEEKTSEVTVNVPALRVTKITAGEEGAYLEIRMPVSYDAFHRIERSLSDRGIRIHSRGGGGDNTGCAFSFGPFLDAENTHEMLIELAAAVERVRDNEGDYQKRFNSLLGDWPRATAGGQES